MVSFVLCSVGSLVVIELRSEILMVITRVSTEADIELALTGSSLRLCLMSPETMPSLENLSCLRADAWESM